MDVGYFDYQYQELVLKNAYLKTVLQEADYQTLNGEDAVCSMSGEYTTETLNDKEVKIYTFGNLDSMRIFYVEGEKYYSLYDLGGFYYICTKEYATVNLEGSVLKTKNICRIYEKDGKYNMIINPSSPSYTGTVDTQGEWLSVKAATGFTFLEGKTYNIQIQNSAYLKIGKAVFSFNNEKFDYKANGSNLYIKTNYNPCVLSILEVGTVVEDDVQKGSFDKATQTLTLNNAYVIGLINQMSDELPVKQVMLETIGSNDLIYDFSQATTYPTTEMLYCPVNIEYQGNPLGFVLSMSGGSYTIIVAEGVLPLNTEGLNGMLGGGTIQDLINMGGVADENVFTITGTQGNYDVVFN